MSPPKSNDFVLRGITVYENDRHCSLATRTSGVNHLLIEVFSNCVDQFCAKMRQLAVSR